jgi:hypothetical protein
MNHPLQTVLAIACVFASAAAQPAGVRAAELSQLGFVKGHSWGWVGTRGDYAGPEAADSMHKLAETGATWTCIAFGANMTTIETPAFTWGDANPRMVTDDEIRRAIALARENNLKVILKPVVNSDDSVWRAWIKFYRPLSADEIAVGLTSVVDPWGDEPVTREGQTPDLAKWDVWWRCFRGYLLHYAKIAEAEHVEMLCLGCEMNSTEAFDERWRELIADIRAVYHGAITYDVNHGRENAVPWWDAVDVISVSAYYQVPPPEGVTEEEAVMTTTPEAAILAQLEKNKQELADLSAKYNKPILFIETGVTNVRGCARYPWSHPDANTGHPLDEQEQVNYYNAMFKAFWDEPWFMGFTWWDWPARLYDREDADEHRGFCIYGKAAEEVVRQWYAKPR